MRRPKLSRRSFLSLLGISAVVAALPWQVSAKGIQNITGHLRQVSAHDYVFSAHRYHCDYCYTGPAGSVFKVSSPTLLETGSNITLRGRVNGNRFICRSV